MRMSRFRIQRFKAFAEADLAPAGLTILIGGNNQGKSTVLQAMALTGQSATANSFLSQGPLVDLGADLRALTHAIDVPTRGQSPDGWQITWTWDALSEGPDRPSPSVPVQVTYSAHLVPEGHVVPTFDVRLEAPRGRLVEVHSSSWPTAKYEVVAGPGRSIHGEVPPLRLEITLSASSPSVAIPQAGLSASVDASGLEQGVPAVVAAYALAHSVPYTAAYVREALTSFRYIGANRHVEASVFALGLQALANPRTAQELVDTLAYNSDVLGKVSERCRMIFGYGVDVDLLPNRQVALTAMGQDRQKRNIVNMGTGLIQLIWILTQLELSASAPQMNQALQPLVGIEEPELHLHPGLQPHAARVLAEFVKSGLQIVCTTQSDHFLMSVLELVLDKTIAASEVAVYYIANGRAERLDLDENGQLRGGLKGFFEENEDQLKRHIELLKRGG